MRPTGLIPDRHAARERDASEYAFGAQMGSGIPLQRVAWIRDQLEWPSCVGQAFAAAIDAARISPPWASAVSIWREARRRQGRIEQIDAGTRLEYAVAGLVARGWDPYVLGEDRDTVEAGRNAPPAGDDLADELFAYDKRATGKRYRIGSTGADRVDAVELAIRAGLGVVLGTGVRTPFFDFVGSPSRPDHVLGALYLGGESNGHAMRVFAVDVRDSGRIFGLQNSWGSGFGGCRLPDGTWQPGCCWVSERVISESWDLHVLEVQP